MVTANAAAWVWFLAAKEILREMRVDTTVHVVSLSLSFSLFFLSCLPTSLKDTFFMAV